MNFVNKTPKTTSASQPDMHPYQLFGEELGFRQNQSVTIHDRGVKKQKKQKITHFNKLSLTKMTLDNFNTLIKFSKKTYQQIKQHQKPTLAKNFLESLKESDNVVYKVVKKMPKLLEKKDAIIPPQKIVGGWFYKLKEKCTFNRKKPQQQLIINNGFREEDDMIII